MPASTRRRLGWALLVAVWANAHPSLAQAWAKSEDATKDYVKAWFSAHPAELVAWKADNADKKDPSAEDLAVTFFVGFAKENPSMWLTVVENKGKKTVELVKKDATDAADISAVFFDRWRHEHADVELEDVPADLVMSSGSGLDPHITLAGAMYQLDRVAGKWAETTKGDQAKIRGEIETLVKGLASSPMGGLAGVPLVNVLEANLALRKKYAP